MVKLSIIIPTLNEEKHLPKLLGCIKNQTYRNYEVIVADGRSKDKTRQIAKKFGCRIVDGIGHPSKGRNNGVNHSKGRYILFLDSDVLFDEKFLEISIREFEKRNLDAATFYATPLSENYLDRTLVSLFNLVMRAFQYSKPFAGAYAILVKKSLHDKISGFDEAMPLLDDSEYAQRASKVGKFRVINGKKVFISMRRLEMYGRINVTKTFLYHYIFKLLGRKVSPKLFKTTRFNYQFSYK